MTLHAQYSGSIFDFVLADSASICGHLSGTHIEWQSKVELLQQQFNQLPHLAGDVILGLTDHNLGLEIEIVILYRGLVFPVSIDLINSRYNENATASIHQQARSLKEQHEKSGTKFIVPVQIATNAPSQGSAITVSEDLVANTMCDSGDHLAALIEHFSNQYKDDQINLSDWLKSPAS